MEHPLQKTIEENLAGFLQKSLLKKVEKESWIDFSKEPNQPLSKYKIKKDKRDLLWWINFSKNLVKQTLP